MKKRLIFVIYLIAITIVFLNRELLMNWIEYSDPSYLPLMLLLSTFFATVPVVPFSLFAGIMGAKYGVLIGLLINWLGGVSASVIYFLLARYMFADFLKKYIKQYKGINKFNSMIEKNAFFAIFFARMIPVIPPPVINIYSGLTKISFLTYFSASAIGKIPPMFIYAYGGKQIFSSFQNFLLGISAYFLFLLIVFLIYRTWSRSKSKRSLV
ncbi:MAG TPA: TVP38/TMEM64 family protein [Bacillus sp. (in: firmicutes)]|nr:TVP38/TMEM64 family protein [Bacillus sp. (in: firmicutes)]